MLSEFEKWSDSRDEEELPTSAPTVIPSTVVPELLKLSDDEKEQKAWEMSMAGLTNARIASMFGVTPRTIIRYKQRFLAKTQEQMLTENTALTMIASEVAKLDEIERIALMEVNAIKSAGKRIDPKTGKVEHVEAIGDLGDKQRFMKIALEANEKRRNLLITVGIIPKDPDRVITSISRKDDDNTKKDDGTLTNEELKAILVETLGRTKFIP